MCWLFDDEASSDTRLKNKHLKFKYFDCLSATRPFICFTQYLRMKRREKGLCIPPAPEDARQASCKWSKLCQERKNVFKQIADKNRELRPLRCKYCKKRMSCCNRKKGLRSGVKRYKIFKKCKQQCDLKRPKDNDKDNEGKKKKCEKSIDLKLAKDLKKCICCGDIIRNDYVYSDVMDDDEQRCEGGQEAKGFSPNIALDAAPVNAPQKRRVRRNVYLGPPNLQLIYAGGMPEEEESIYTMISEEFATERMPLDALPWNMYPNQAPRFPAK